MIVDIVRKYEPITSEQIADKLNLTRSALRPDLAVLTMIGILEARPRVGYFFTGKIPQNLISKRIKDIKVDNIKAVPVVITENTSVYDAIVTLFLTDVGTLFVTGDDGFLSSLVSRKDLLKIAIGNADIHKMPVGIVMTRMPNIITVTPDESAYEAAKKIVDHQVDALPVVHVVVEDNQEKFKIVGKVTKSTFTKLFVELVEI
ncbi:MAG: helix-turn-helix transcriptional regulator [Tepidanaerobacteraceae bacterium]